MTAESIWVLVADGNAARFFMRPRAGFPLNELTELALTAEAERRHHGRPSAIKEPANHGHQVRPAHDTAQNESEREFLRHIAGRLNLAVQDNAIGELVLVAPPRALGVLRDHLSAHAQAHVSRQIAKDVVRETRAEIEARLALDAD